MVELDRGSMSIGFSWLLHADACTQTQCSFNCMLHSYIVAGISYMIAYMICVDDMIDDTCAYLIVVRWNYDAAS